MRINFSIIFFLILLTACTSPPVKIPPAERQHVYYNTQKQLQMLRSWEMQGRLKIHHRGRSDTVNVTWLQEGNSYGIKLAGAFGQGTVYLLGDKNGVTYKDSDGNVDAAPTPESLLELHTGYSLPVSNLQYWALGRPAPGSIPELQLNEQGYVIEMRQNEWLITYQYYRLYNGMWMPTRVLIEHPDDFRITLHIHNWDLNWAIP